MFDREKAQRTAAAMVAALIFSSVMVGAAVGPAGALENSPVAYAQVQIADQAHA